MPVFPAITNLLSQGYPISPTFRVELFTKTKHFPLKKREIKVNLQSEYNSSFKCKDPLESLTRLNMCISDIRVWMIKNKLKINNSQTEFIIFRSPLLKQFFCDLSVSVGDMQVSPSSKVRYLGVVFDQYLTFHDHINGICKSTHFHLRGI